MDMAVKPTAATSAQNAAASAEKAKALQAALAQIEKQFGKGTIMRLGEGEVIEDIQVVSTGSLGLDIALGVGGLPRGRVIEIYGPESSGKTTLTLQVIAEMQNPICSKLGREFARHADQPARYWRTSAGNCRQLGALWRGRFDRGRLCRRLDTKSRAGRRNGRQPAGFTSSVDEPSPAQAHRTHQKGQLHGHFHQPNPHENWRDVW
jgi:recA bacterial DNA recombination protein